MQTPLGSMPKPVAWIVAVLGALWGAILGSAALWPLFTRQTLPEWLNDGGWRLMSSLLSTSLLAGVSIILIVLSVGILARLVRNTSSVVPTEPEPVDLVDEARRRAIRVQVGQFLRDVYHNKARHAIGDAFVEANTVVNALRGQGTDLLRLLVSTLIADRHERTESFLRPMLEVQNCETDEQFAAFTRAWGELFAHYQRLVGATFDASQALGIPLWGRISYEEWRDKDKRFLADIRQAEHMEGCAHLAFKIRQVGWGEHCRPDQPKEP